MKLAALLLALGFAAGRRARGPCPPCPRCRVAQLDDMERQVLAATCEAQRVEDVLRERVLRTGRVNP